MNFFKQYDTNVIGISDELNKDQLSLLLGKSNINRISEVITHNDVAIFTDQVLPQRRIFYLYETDNSEIVASFNIVKHNDRPYCILIDDRHNIEWTSIVACQITNTNRFSITYPDVIYVPMTINNIDPVVAQYKLSCIVYDNITATDVQLHLDDKIYT